MKQFILKHQLAFFLGIVAALCAVVAIQSINLGDHYYGEIGPYRHYNNYVIFKESFAHLLDGSNLYVLYPEEHWDLYKYTPTFSLFFGLFWVMPDWLGLFSWHLLNGLILYYAIWKLNFSKRSLIWWAGLFMVPEFVLAMQNAQSNSLIAGLLIMTFVFLENKRTGLAVLMVLLASFIKPFGLVGFALFLFYPEKLKAIGWTVGLGVLLFLLPIVVTGFDGLIWQYQNWLISFTTVK